MFNFSDLKKGIQEVEDWLRKELSVIRTGRATPAILDFVQIEAYGARMNIKELANILVEDVKTVRIEPWDPAIGKQIEKSIISANLGVSSVPFEKGLRIIFPELTSERREQFIKVVKSKLEEARVSLRSLRDKAWKAIEEKEKAGGMGEDEKFRFKEDMQKIVDEGSSSLEKMALSKEAEIKS